MKKRIAIIAVTAVAALSAVGSASAALWEVMPGSHHQAPAGSQCADDLACRA